MGEQLRGGVDAGLFAGQDRLAQLQRVPVNDDSGEQVEAGDTGSPLRAAAGCSPPAGLSLGDDGAPVWRGGARWVLASSARLALEGTRREPANDDAAPDQRIGFTLSVRW